MKYICLGYIEPAKLAGMTEDERLAMFDECFEYDDHLRANGHFGAGEALQPPETALTLYWKNGKVATTDGPYAETKEQLGGFFVLEARDMNHAIQLMSQHPGLKLRLPPWYRFINRAVTPPKNARPERGADRSRQGAREHEWTRLDNKCV